MEMFVYLPKVALFLGGVLNLALAILHVGIIFAGSKGYRYFGAGEKMVYLAEEGSFIPPVVTSFLALIFFIFSIYAFSAINLFSVLAFQKLVIMVISIIYLLRGSIVIFQCLPIKIMQTTFGHSKKEIIFSVISLFIGFAYLFGSFEMLKT